MSIVAMTDAGVVAPPPPPATVEYGYPLPVDPLPVIERSADGRYLLPSPLTGERQRFTRMTSLVHILDDDYRLRMWERREIAGGAYTLGLSGASSHDPSTREGREAIATDAERVATMGRAAEFGTAVHAWCETVDAGMPLAVVPDDDRCTLSTVLTDKATGAEVMVTATIRDRVLDYIRVRSEAGLTPLPGHSERTVWTTIRVPIETADGAPVTMEVVGTYDRVYVTDDGRTLLGDLKTSRWAGEFSYNSWSAQLEGYAGAPWVWDRAAQQWTPQSLQFDGLVVVAVPSLPTTLGRDAARPQVIPLSRARGAALLPLAASMRIERRAARARDEARIGTVMPTPTMHSVMHHRIIGALQMCISRPQAEQVYTEYRDTIATLGLHEWAAGLLARFPE